MYSPAFPVKEIFEIIEIADDHRDNSKEINIKILKLFQKCFSGERSIYFIPNGCTKFRDLLKDNMDETFNQKYKAYYHKFDPLHLMERDNIKLSDNEIVRNVDYSLIKRSEYYNDFLSPQQIHYKMIVYLMTETDLLGKILLTKSKDSGNFSREEIDIAKEVAPYIAHALEHHKLRKEFADKNDLFQMVENNMNSGVVLLNPCGKLIHTNPVAVELCRLIDGKTRKIENLHDLDPVIIKDYLEMTKNYKREKSNATFLSRKRTLKIDCNKFSILSRLIKDQNDIDYFLIDIQKDSSRDSINRKKLSGTFGLSAREIDVVVQLVKGLHNSEIAENLFISEVTVKKHLQNIFLKTCVNSRTSLIRMILSDPSLV